MKEYLKDGWNWVHLFGSCVLTITLSKFMPILYAGFVTLGLGFLWECADEAQKRGYIDVWFLDPAGFDWRDWLVMDLIGIFLAMYLTGGIYGS